MRSNSKIWSAVKPANELGSVLNVTSVCFGLGGAKLAELLRHLHHRSSEQTFRPPQIATLLDLVRQTITHTILFANLA
jgi:hypothetical protein